MLSFGTQEFFDELKRTLNGDKRFRELGKGSYNATELIEIKDMGIGIWQRTVDGEILAFNLIKRSEVKNYEAKADIVYFVESYDAMVKISTGQESFVELVISDEIVFRGSMKKVMSIQAPSERMEIILRDATKRIILPTRIQYQKLLDERGYL
ncbi:MAG: hypothetical protein M0Z77_06785 [Thermoplasmatales archaeon]|nr:hypothetical protein [Candidatus Thermoplasmatota archaeon]MDA8055338.1 hypothetical protein [Thermoplasmatales archaeon]